MYFMFRFAPHDFLLPFLLLLLSDHNGLDDGPLLWREVRQIRPLFHVTAPCHSLQVATNPRTRLFAFALPRNTTLHGQGAGWAPGCWLLWDMSQAVPGDHYHSVRAASRSRTTLNTLCGGRRRRLLATSLFSRIVWAVVRPNITVCNYPFMYL